MRRESAHAKKNGASKVAPLRVGDTGLEPVTSRM